MPEMFPPPGERVLKYVGDRIQFVLETESKDGQAFLRTNLGRGRQLRREIIEEHKLELLELSGQKLPAEQKPHVHGLAWRDLPMELKNNRWDLELTVTEVGFFQAKAYFVDSSGKQIWPQGPNFGVTVHPSLCRTANTIYCAFPRMFGETKTAIATISNIDPAIARLDKQGYAVLPPSGKLRDVTKALPHIFETLGCRILQLLPVNPTPTTYARFGRYGSPYACEDLIAIDPSLVEFDRRTTGVDQFKELAYETHLRGGRLLLDVVVNHTGWGSTLQENNPDWFLREKEGTFVSPGAWGTTWEDLVELDHRYPFSWDCFAEVFLTWCRRGVDGFRCDAGYKVPTRAWRYITARVREEFPDAVFLLEGLGGAWEATEDLLTYGGMQLAYSELFQNFTGLQVSGYLDHSIQKSARVGALVHYSETHDNDRLAKKGRAWALMRNQLSALASHSGGFAFTAGVEWLAAEKINVHSSRGLAWGNPSNLLPELQRLNDLLAEHPCFFDGAKLKRISSSESPVYVLEREAADGLDRVLVLINLDAEKGNSVLLDRQTWVRLGQPAFDLLRNSEAKRPRVGQQAVEFALAPAEVLCLAETKGPKGLAGEEYRGLRALHALAIKCLASILEPEEIGSHPWTDLARLFEESPEEFLVALSVLDATRARADLLDALRSAKRANPFPNVVHWELIDRRRVTLLPMDHWLLVRDTAPFRATLESRDHSLHRESASLREGQIAIFPPHKEETSGEADLFLERYTAAPKSISGQIRIVSPHPKFKEQLKLPLTPRAPHPEAPLVLLANKRGGMARMCVDLGAVKSKYDCVLGANLHPDFPVDRHIFIKRMRAWANANHFISDLSAESLMEFEPGPPARWKFAVIAGGGALAHIEMKADMLDNQNTTIFEFQLLPSKESGPGFTRITIRVDIEDRNFHTQTEHNGGADHHFSTNLRLLAGKAGFAFAPAPDRQVRAYATRGEYHPAAEWSHNLPHKIEQTRGQVASGDAYSPGWFDLPLDGGVPVYLVMTAESADPSLDQVLQFADERRKANDLATNRAQLEPNDSFGRQLALATQAYVVRRDQTKTVIAGYPWFLDWGRDSLICARGLIAAGMIEEVRDLLITFGRFEQGGTLPNTIHGADASNRDTSDAPLWYGVVAEELAEKIGSEVYGIAVDSKGRRVRDVLRSIAAGYIDGTSNKIQMDPASGLVWSPSHFTWMDTNFPAGTPREGYPVEIQALWIRLLGQLHRIGEQPHKELWELLASKAEASLQQLYWVQEKTWIADCLNAKRGTSAVDAVRDDSLRSNCLFPVAFGLFEEEQSRQCLGAVARYLVIPSALRTLAPLPATIPLPIHAPDWRLLNNPGEPYQGRYEGDEDTQRKPAYHNGTAWTWTFATFCEALAKAWNFQPAAISAAKAYLGSMEGLLETGCLGQIPEILDGDAPHTPRGCDAQAWGVTEALRVWKLLSSR
jgi:starch synthase (maltosyl-transferring)